MAEGMFRGRAFTIPYDNSMDEKIASMARAQITTKVASPGAVIQVGDQVLPVGITPQQVHMGDLDIKLRSFHQLTNEAQSVVRNNIQWQYGEQVGDVQKGFLSELLGLGKYASPFKSPVQARPDAPLPQPEAFPSAAPAPAPAPAAPAAAAAPAAQTPKPARQSPSAPRRSRPKKTPVAAPAISAVAEQLDALAAPAEAPASVPAKPKRSRSAAKAPAAPAVAAPQADTQAAPPVSAPADAGTFSLRFDPSGPISATAHGALVTALHAVARAHKKQEGEADFQIGIEDGRFVSTRRGKDGSINRHVLSFDPATKTFQHMFDTGDPERTTVTSFTSTRDLHSHIRGL